MYLSEYENRVTALTSHKQLALYMSEVKMPTSSSTIELLAEDTLTIHYCMMFRRANMLSNIFIRKIDQLITGGISNRITRDDHIKEQLSKQDEEHKPHPLTMKHLGVCFAAILICLGLSFAVFLLECSTRFFV